MWDALSSSISSQAQGLVLLPYILLLCFGIGSIFWGKWRGALAKGKPVSGALTKVNPISVNFHFTRKCNYECGFCFHTSKTSYLAPLESAKVGLRKLAEAGMKKMNFSGGEPFLYASHLGEMCKFCKEGLGLESVSIVSNGSKIRREFFELYGKYVDILAISVDSFDESTNEKIGRGKYTFISKFYNK